ncbi:MAG: PorT family protein [Muricauda sp.]|nr:porin family protein [Allomuricauda sp.]MBA4745799.1 PorT family protein [Allomuricauda sp.]
MIRTVLQFIVSAVCLLLSISVLGQTGMDSTVVPDSRYLEDQFYIGVGYNVLLDTPDEVGQQNLSYNLQAGFIKDIPLNQRRNFGVGLGLGYAVNSYYSNIVSSKESNTIVYQVMEGSNFNRSKFETHSIEFPLELRWRTSTAEEYKFWRIYAGAKLGYVFSGRSKLVTDSGNDSFSNNDVEKFQYGLMLNFGYNTWNIHAYYALHPLLKEGTALNGNPIDFRVLRIGLIFYIL